jgi:hypothetical protein
VESFALVKLPVSDAAGRLRGHADANLSRLFVMKRGEVPLTAP